MKKNQAPESSLVIREVRDVDGQEVIVERTLDELETTECPISDEEIQALYDKMFPEDAEETKK